MSKSSQRKRSMYELGKSEGPYYNRPCYPKSKEYMRGWNKTYTEGCWITLRSPKNLTPSRTPSFLVTLTVTLYLGSLIL